MAHDGDLDPDLERALKLSLEEERARMREDEELQKAIKASLEANNEDNEDNDSVNDSTNEDNDASRSLDSTNDGDDEFDSMMSTPGLSNRTGATSQDLEDSDDDEDRTRDNDYTMDSEDEMSEFCNSMLGEPSPGPSRGRGGRGRAHGRGNKPSKAPKGRPPSPVKITTVRNKKSQDYKDVDDILRRNLPVYIDFKLTAVDVIENSRELKQKFDAFQTRLSSKGANHTPMWAFHAAPTHRTLTIIKENLKPAYAKTAKYGNGLYFHETPYNKLVDEQGLLLCQILPGTKFKTNKNDSGNVPTGYDSKEVNQAVGINCHVVPNPDQVLPRYIVHLELKKTKKAQKVKWEHPEIVSNRIYEYDWQRHVQDLANPAGAAANINAALNNDEVVKRMRKMFESSLKLHATGEYMEPAAAVNATLYPHQMYALAWLSNRENGGKKLGVTGGILADDMGLGKTLTILSLIMTNFHDKRPLSRPHHGFKRVLDKNVAKYLPQKNNKATNADNKKQERARKDVGTGLTSKSKSNGLSLKNMLDGDVFSTSKKGKSSSRHKAKNSKSYQAQASSRMVVKSIDEELDEVDESLIENNTDDEFDSMLSDSKDGLADKLGIDTSSELFKKSDSLKHNDGLSDDEEYQNMTEEERNLKMRPKLNVDGNCDFSSDDDFVPSPKKSRSKRRLVVSDSDSDEEISHRKKRSFDLSVSNVSVNGDEFQLPDLEDEVDDPEDTEKPKNSVISEASPSAKKRAIPELSEEQRKNLIRAKRDPAPLIGSRRKATLIVTPTSLISHWIEQIETFIDPRVNLKIFVHHGQNRALISRELEDHDIVLTTYGTLQHEFGQAFANSPLIKAKWLRVCLDEGHMVKNHRSKTSKAACALDTQRRWIITGTPIQNNLGELWSLLLWLQMEPYCDNRPMFKNQIEQPVKNGDPRGLIRLQTLIETICLRRTKNDEVNGKPIVSLPVKEIVTKELEFTDEEKTIYMAYQKHAKKIIERYNRRGTLLKNYAHIFAIMMRLRQLCCHRELVPVNWHNINMDELEQMAADLNGDARDDDNAPVDAADDAELKVLAEQLRDMIKAGMSDECSICLSEFNTPVITPCAHVYCKPCIVQYIDTARPPPAQCPLCRQPVFAQKLMEAAPAAEDEENDDLNASDEAFEDVEVKVSSTKVNAVLEAVARDRKRDPEAKSIIVSQFTSLLSIIQPQLTEMGINWTRLDGSMNMKQRASVVSDFQDTHPDSSKVLLLSLRAGGVGLNLTAANRMYLLDPAWNPSTEEQCFDRIHRLGQMRDVTITKFVMKESIEQKMLGIQEKKRDLISGAFCQNEHQRRQQRIQDIRDIFGI